MFFGRRFAVKKAWFLLSARFFDENREWSTLVDQLGRWKNIFRVSQKQSIDE
jgi:hypothetical protein